MVDAGLFKDERVELIRGTILQMSPQKPAHAVVVQILTRILMPALVGRADVRVQLPFAAGDDSMPEPDLAVVAVAHFGEPHPDRAFLIVEVAESSIEDDRIEKTKIYAAARVPEYWVVNIPDRVIEVRSEPSGRAYAIVTPHRAGQKIAVAAFPDVVVDVADLFDTRA